MEKLARASGITVDRLDELWRGDHPTESELEALAAPFRTDAASLRASIEYEGFAREKA